MVGKNRRRRIDRTSGPFDGSRTFHRDSGGRFSGNNADPLAPARHRGRAARAELLEHEGGALTVDEVTALLQVTSEAVEERRRGGKLLGLRTDRDTYAYPAWQFTRHGLLPGMEEVLADLGVRDPWMQAAFFLSGNLRLNGASPLAELRRGHVEHVRRAARAYGEQGAD